jgi:hypothetical protein
MQVDVRSFAVLAEELASFVLTGSSFEPLKRY